MEDFIIVKVTPSMEAARIRLAELRAEILVAHAGEITEVCLDRYLKALEKYWQRRMIISQCRSIPKEKWSEKDREELKDREYGLRQMVWVLGLSNEWVNLSHHTKRTISPDRIGERAVT